jgi:hypothetical protein
MHKVADVVDLTNWTEMAKANGKNSSTTVAQYGQAYNSS